MTTSPALTVASLLLNLRDACLGAYDDTPGSPPKPDGVLHHDLAVPVIDCGDLLIVMATSVTSAFQGPPEACAIVQQVSMSATVTRCIPNLTTWGRAASRDDLTASTRALAADASVLWRGVTGRCAAGTLWTSFAELGCADTQFREMRPGALGGIGWWTWSVSVSVTSPLV